jgi:glycosyltransferase involved in cell wall biosynthesis
MSKLLVVNYCMDLDNPSLSHQVEAVNSLAQYFENVTVVTGKIGRFEPASNVKVISSNWIPGRPISNLINFYRRALPELAQADVVFSHMAEVQALFLAPFAKIIRRPHFLWYAHAYPSKYLSCAYFLLNGIVTSTSGSCPIKKRNVFTIGQAINPKDFYRVDIPTRNLDLYCHVGRFDSSKGIEEIIRATELQRVKNPNIKLTLIGSPSNEKQMNYSLSVKKKYENNDWILFSDSISREWIPDFLSHQDIFVHAYKGSLDKTLIEATLFGLPVVTLNLEYLRVFGPWLPGDINNVSLEAELKFLNEMDIASRVSEVRRRQALALSGHTLDSWAKKLSELLNGAIKF